MRRRAPTRAPPDRRLTRPSRRRRRLGEPLPELARSAPAWCARGGGPARSPRRRGSEPPIADPRLQELRADRSSRPIPRATSITSAPSSSETFAISLMNEIFVARKAFEASLIISALATSVLTTGASSGCVQRRHARRRTPRARRRRRPPRGRGCMKSSTARALLEELRVRDVAECSGSRRRWIERPVPTGTVLFITSACSRRVAQLVDHASPRARGRRRPSRWAACRRRRTAAGRARAAVAHVGREVEPLGVLRDELAQAGLVDRHLAARAATRPSRARCRAPTTSWPSSAKQAAVTRPTQPTPMTPIGSRSRACMRAASRLPRAVRAPDRAGDAPASASRRATAAACWRSSRRPCGVRQATSRRRSPS